jgi:hypothetical protein
MGLVAAILVEALYPMRLDYLLSLLPQLVSMYLLFCLLANCLSILAPMRLAAGTLRASNAKMVPILLHVAFLFLLPVVVGPAMVPLLLALAVDSSGWVDGVPVCLVLSIIECVAVVFFYRFVLKWQGIWLQTRERAILDVVTTKAE